MSENSADRIAIESGQETTGLSKARSATPLSPLGGQTIGLTFSAQAAEQERLFAASHTELLLMLESAATVQWQAMIDKTVDLGRGFRHIEAVLDRMADKYGDSRAAKVHAYMTRIEPSADSFYRPRMSHYAPRGLPVMQMLYKTFKWKLPKQQVESVHAAIAREAGNKQDWDTGRAAMSKWISLTAA